MPEYGYLDIGYLDSGQNNLLLHPHSEILCGAALPAFVAEKHVPGVCNLRQCFFRSPLTKFNETGLHRNGLKASASDFNVVPS